MKTTFVLERSSKSVLLQPMTLIILVAWCLALLMETMALFIRPCLAVHKDVVIRAITAQANVDGFKNRSLLTKRVLIRWRKVIRLYKSGRRTLTSLNLHNYLPDKANDAQFRDV